MGLLEPITHKQEIEDLLSEAQEEYDSSLKKFEEQKKQTTKIRKVTEDLSMLINIFDSIDTRRIDESQLFSSNKYKNL